MCQTSLAVYQIAFWVTDNLIIPTGWMVMILLPVLLEIKCLAESRKSVLSKKRQ